MEASIGEKLEFLKKRGRRTIIVGLVQLALYISTIIAIWNNKQELAIVVIFYFPMTLIVGFFVLKSRGDFHNIKLLKLTVGLSVFTILLKIGEITISIIRMINTTGYTLISLVLIIFVSLISIYFIVKTMLICKFLIDFEKSKVNNGVFLEVR